jgi:hypothetical protein
MSIAKKQLARFGIQLAFDDAGIPTLIGNNGIVCKYSARCFCPVVGLGPPENAILIRWLRDGAVELQIEGQRYRHGPEDERVRMPVPR